MSELTTRIATALPAAALLIFVTWLGGWIFHAAVALLALLAARELADLCARSGRAVNFSFAVLFTLWILSVPVSPWLVESGLLLLVLFVSAELLRRRAPDLDRLVATPFAALYPAAGLLSLLLIREAGSPQTGFELVVLLLMTVWGNDVFAYFGGKSFGSRLLAPKISPGKTWEGFYSGVAGSVAGLTLAWLLLPELAPFSWLSLLPAAVLVSLFGPIGDLTESRLKRAAGVKDSSALLPGHGGVLDRLDALLLAAPVFYLYLYLLAEAGYAAF